MTVNAFIIALTYAGVTAVTIGLFGSRMRASAYALFSVFYYTGYALGPFYAGFVSTRLEPYYGIESLRYALLSGVIFMIWAAWHFWQAAKTIEKDYERANAA